jgi:predicted phage-related endonuclease
MPTIAISTEAEWLAARESNIGGSEVAALFCRWRAAEDGETLTLHAYEEPPEDARCLGSCSPYSTPHALWLAKAGQIMPKDFNPSERMLAGTHLEPAIAAWAQATWGWKLRKVRRYHRHPAVRGWGASVDYEEVSIGRAPVEIKNIDGLVAARSWVIEGDEILDAPLHVQLQLQHYIGARGAEGGWLVACIGGNRLARGYFPVHVRTQARIAEAIGAFWAGVAAGAPPHHAVDADAVCEQFASGGGAPLDLSTDDGIDALLRRYLRWRQHCESVQATVDNLKARICARLGDSAKAITAAHRISWPVINRAEKAIPAKVQPAKSYRGGLTIAALKGL